jgi:hypothetical protein
MTLAHLQPSQREALLALVQHHALRRTREGYRPSTPGVHPLHSTRAVTALVRAQLATWTDGELELQPTAAGRDLVAAAATTPTLARNLAA